MAETFLPDAIAELVQDYPKSSVEILDKGSRDILKGFEEGDIIHFAIIPEPERLTGLTATVLLDEPVVAIVSRDHPLANCSELPFAKLADYPNIALRSSISVGLAMDKIARDAKIKLEPTFETSRHTTLARLVQAGLGIGVLPAMSLPIAKWPQLVAIPLADPVVSRRIVVVQRKGEVLPPAGRKLFSIIMSLAHQAAGLNRTMVPTR
jgi:DNA-binding transcriptional LysR family regulator